MYWLHYPVGFLDEMLSTFDNHNHPVIIIGSQALCWMAVRLETNQELDLLVRPSQQTDLIESLLASGCWIPAPAESDDGQKPAPRVPRLKHLDQDFHILLWSEDLYHLKVDDDLTEVPHICAWNAVLAEPHFYHPPPPRVRPHHVLPNPGVVAVPRTPDQTPPPARPHRTPIFIPTIPRYITACLARIIKGDHDATCTNSSIDIYYLTRYLFLELDAQRAKLLPMLPEQHRNRLEPMLDRYVRTVKADFQPGGKGWEGTGRTPFFLRIKQKREKQNQDAALAQDIQPLPS